jgi:RloB-like protein
MAKINRKKLIDRTVNVRDARLCVIATEGRKTEKQYFNLFKNQRVIVKILPTEEDNKSSPHHVLTRLDKFKQEHDLVDDDTLWLMIDVDHHRPKQLSSICTEAVQKGFKLAISNPCFEVWLYLHFDIANPDDNKCKDVENRLQAKLGSYNKSNLNLGIYKDHIAKAVQRAKILDEEQNNHYWPTCPGTHVYKVVETLL